jgi:hypothetical protein
MPRLWSDIRDDNSKYFVVASLVALALALAACQAAEVESDGGAVVGTSAPPATTRQALTTDPPLTTTATQMRPTATPEEVESIIASLPSRSPPSGEAEGSYRSFAIERVEFYASCLTDQGMAVEIDYVDLGVTYRIPSGQEDAYNRIKTGCRAATRERFGMTDHPAPLDLERWYQAYVWTWNCLDQHGYTLNDPPTIDSFVDSGGANWQPFAELVMSGAAPDGDARRALEQSCPQDVDFLIWFLDL